VILPQHRRRRGMQKKEMIRNFSFSATGPFLASVANQLSAQDAPRPRSRAPAAARPRTRGPQPTRGLGEVPCRLNSGQVVLQWLITRGKTGHSLPPVFFPFWERQEGPLRKRQPKRLDIDGPPAQPTGAAGRAKQRLNQLACLPPEASGQICCAQAISGIKSSRLPPDRQTTMWRESSIGFFSPDAAGKPARGQAILRQQELAAKWTCRKQNVMERAANAPSARRPTTEAARPAPWHRSATPPASGFVAGAKPP